MVGDRQRHQVADRPGEALLVGGPAPGWTGVLMAHDSDQDPVPADRGVDQRGHVVGLEVVFAKGARRGMVHGVVRGDGPLVLEGREVARVVGPDQRAPPQVRRLGEPVRVVVEREALEVFVALVEEPHADVCHFETN